VKRLIPVILVGLLVPGALGEPSGLTEAHALVGYEWRTSPGLGLSLEANPGLLLLLGFFFSVSFGVNFYV
jgi:hypothetical protein